MKTSCFITKLLIPYSEQSEKKLYTERPKFTPTPAGFLLQGWQWLKQDGRSCGSSYNCLIQRRSDCGAQYLLSHVAFSEPSRLSTQGT
jgi:hypothetical protein